MSLYTSSWGGQQRILEARTGIQLARRIPIILLESACPSGASARANTVPQAVARLRSIPPFVNLLHPLGRQWARIVRSRSPSRCQLKNGGAASRTCRRPTGSVPVQGPALGAYRVGPRTGSRAAESILKSFPELAAKAGGAGAAFVCFFGRPRALDVCTASFQALYAAFKLFWSCCLPPLSG